MRQPPDIEKLLRSEPEWGTIEAAPADTVDGPDAWKEVSTDATRTTGDDQEG